MLNNIVDFYVEWLDISDDTVTKYTCLGDLVFPNNEMVRFSLKKTGMDDGYDDKFQNILKEENGKYHLKSDSFDPCDEWITLTKVNEDETEILLRYEDDEEKFDLYASLKS